MNQKIIKQKRSLNQRFPKVIFKHLQYFRTFTKRHSFYFYTDLSCFSCLNVSKDFISYLPPIINWDNIFDPNSFYFPLETTIFFENLSFDAAPLAGEADLRSIWEINSGFSPFFLLLGVN